MARKGHSNIQRSCLARGKRKQVVSEERDEVMKLKAAIQGKYEELKASGHPNWKQVNLMDWNESDWPYFK